MKNSRVCVRDGRAVQAFSRRRRFNTRSINGFIPVSRAIYWGLPAAKEGPFVVGADVMVLVAGAPFVGLSPAVPMPRSAAARNARASVFSGVNFYH